MRGINKVVISGNVGSSIKFSETGKGVQVCSFQLASDRYSRGSIITAWVKINVYRDQLVRVCDTKLEEGCYVIVEGELMNRDSKDLKELLEVRALELIFTNPTNQERRDV